MSIESGPSVVTEKTGERRTERRRGVLRKCGTVLTGVGGLGLGVGATSGSAQANTLLQGITISGGEHPISYEIEVTDAIRPMSANLESNDTHQEAVASGTVTVGRDSWQYTGRIRELSFEGTGEVTVYAGGENPKASYLVTLSSAGTTSTYLWSQGGRIIETEPRRGSADEISRTATDEHTATGSVDETEDTFRATGSLDYLHIENIDSNFHWSVSRF